MKLPLLPFDSHVNPGLLHGCATSLCGMPGGGGLLAVGSGERLKDTHSEVRSFPVLREPSQWFLESLQRKLSCRVPPVSKQTRLALCALTVSSGKAALSCRERLCCSRG